MTKETIPQSIIDKINEKYPVFTGAASYGDIIEDANYMTKIQREAAIWGYGLSEARIKELEEKVGELTQDNMTHEYNNAEAERFYPQLKEQIIEEYKASINQEGSLKDGKLEIELIEGMELIIQDKIKAGLIKDGGFQPLPEGFKINLNGSYTAAYEIFKSLIAPLLQNECKGDDLVAEASNSDLAALATLRSTVETQIEQDKKQTL